MPWRYSVFGLSVEADRSIPGLVPSTDRTPPDVRIHTQVSGPPFEAAVGREHYVSPDIGINGKPLLRVRLGSRGDLFQFLYDDDAEFLIDRVGRDVWARWPRSLTIDEIGPYLTGPILGFVLVLRGVTALHASAVAVHERAIAFLGPPGAGKSTTAAAFARLGFQLMSDDIVALVERADGFLVNSGYPWVRLWPESVEALFGSAEALPRISPQDPHWDKRFLDLSEGSRFHAAPLPLGAVYLLGDRDSSERAPRIEGSSPPDKLLSLAGNTYMNYLVDREIRAREFELLGKLARCVPVRLVIPHTDGERLEQLCRLIIDDLESLVTGLATSGSAAQP